MAITKEHLWRISAVAVTGIVMGACKDNQAQNPSAVALSAPINEPDKTLVEEDHIQRYPQYMQKRLEIPDPTSTATPVVEEREKPSPVVIYEAPSIEDKKEIIVGNENEEQKYLQPTYTLDLGDEPPAEDAEFKLGQMNLTDLEWKNLKHWEDLIEQISEWYGLDAKIIASIIIEESGGVNGLESSAGACGLPGILPRNGAPSCEVLKTNAFAAMTWQNAIVFDVCRVQGDDIVTTLARYAGGEQISGEALRYAHRVLQKAGYMDLEGNLHIPEHCQPADEVPEPPTREDIP